MRTRLGAILAVLSLLLCLATVVLWARSQQDVRRWLGIGRGDLLQRRHGGAVYRVHSADGQVSVLHVRLAVGRPPAGDPRERAMAGVLEPWRSVALLAVFEPWDGGAWWNHLGFGFDHAGETELRSAKGLPAVASFTGVAFPHWAAALALAVLPARFLARTLRRRLRRDAGECPACGYDLRATPGRCPECGAGRA